MDRLGLAAPCDLRRWSGTSPGGEHVSRPHVATSAGLFSRQRRLRTACRARRAVLSDSRWFRELPPDAQPTVSTRASLGVRISWPVPGACRLRRPMDRCERHSCAKLGESSLNCTVLPKSLIEEGAETQRRTRDESTASSLQTTRGRSGHIQSRRRVMVRDARRTSDRARSPYGCPGRRYPLGDPLHRPAESGPTIDRSRRPPEVREGGKCALGLFSQEAMPSILCRRRMRIPDQ